MTSTYAKGTRVWLPDSVTGWVAGTVTSITLPSDGKPNSPVSLAISLDGEHETRTLKFTLSALEAAVNSIQPIQPPSGQDAPPPLRNPPLLESSEDLAGLSNLNEPSGESAAHLLWGMLLGSSSSFTVLHAIATRYALHLPYTYSGIVLVR